MKIVPEGAPLLDSNADIDGPEGAQPLSRPARPDRTGATIRIPVPMRIASKKKKGKVDINISLSDLDTFVDIGNNELQHRVALALINARSELGDQPNIEALKGVKELDDLLQRLEFFHLARTQLSRGEEE